MVDDENSEDGSTARNSPGHDEKFCTECGSIIKKEAAMCPECGVEQKENKSEQTQQTTQTTNDITDRRQHELETIASKDKTTVALVSFFITPLGYWMIGKKGLAAINFFTLNYFLLGPFIVPIHTYKMIDDAENELRRAGVRGY